MGKDWQDLQTGVTHQHLYDSISDILQRRWKINKIYYPSPVNALIAKNNLKGKHNNSLQKMADIYSPILKAKDGEITVIIYITCLCSVALCPVSYRIVHHHKGLCSIQKAQDVDIHADSNKSIQKLRPHPSVKSHVQRSGTVSTQEIIKYVDKMREDRNVSKEDGRYKITADKVNNIRKAIKRGRKSDEELTLDTIKKNGDCLFLSRDFDPNDFAIVICDVTFLKETVALHNNGYYDWDGWWKNTSYNICFYALVVVDNYGKGQVLAIGITSGGSQKGVGEVFDILETIHEQEGLPFKVHNINIDACDSSLNEFQKRGYSVTICRFHFIKDIQHHLMSKVSNSEIRSNILGLIYRMIICTYDDDYVKCREILESMDEEGVFYSYFCRQWDKLHELWTNQQRTSSMGHLSTTNYVESAIKVLQGHIKGTTQKKKQLSTCIELLIIAIRNQRLNDIPNDYTESEKEANSRLAEAQKVTSKPTNLGEGNYLVNSCNNDNYYRVVVGVQGFFCSCDDFLRCCGRPCKHFPSKISLKEETNPEGRKQ